MVIDSKRCTAEWTTLSGTCSRIKVDLQQIMLIIKKKSDLAISCDEMHKTLDFNTNEAKEIHNVILACSARDL